LALVSREAQGGVCARARGRSACLAAVLLAGGQGENGKVRAPVHGLVCVGTAV